MTGRILIVEDEREIAELLTAYAERAGFDVRRAGSVPDAIRLHAQFQPDLVLLDVGLPGGDGLDVLTAVRVALTPSEFGILAHMGRQPRRAFTRGELLDAVSPDSDAYDRVIDSHLSKLRQKRAAAGCADMTEPVRGVGYRLWSEY